MPGGIIHPEVAIKSAIEGKAGRYGNIDFSLVIAVNALEEFAKIDEAIDALLERPAWSSARDRNPNSFATRTGRGGTRRAGLSTVEFIYISCCSQMTIGRYGFGSVDCPADRLFMSLPLRTRDHAQSNLAIQITMLFDYARHVTPAGLD
ncbi:hypothetical protein GHK78_10370 [Sinorhizobium meliloti]|uniref:hypothetical protein n=1 Tax=Rhizobium meliloti TaxID=382 RepID=UPI001294BD92|nr:hypothetical protein [Sinorhizobium meliloti]MDW9610879.1 hypothetical protein [Sinorhizobium meliloti]MDW9835929.1 hypothetical protein [Sinorhizobium meliloti]MDX0040382.1 hypothetical protein [Sinorhizobium meliloti]MDX0088904.1 hypothetical protein [Sinorhizobium meliloti]MQX63444.1 hypothetical protein [Sinorhizobium meliloti]